MGGTTGNRNQSQAVAHPITTDAGFAYASEACVLILRKEYNRLGFVGAGECLSDMCLTGLVDCGVGGTCVSPLGTCDCRQGYVGTYCETHLPCCSEGECHGCDNCGCRYTCIDGAIYTAGGHTCGCIGWCVGIPGATDLVDAAAGMACDRSC